MKKILILHGLYMHGIVMQPLARQLRKLGYKTEVISYNTLKINEQSLYDKIAQAIEPDHQNIIVGHSLGGVMALKFALSDHSEKDYVSHLITLGSPLTGASIAHRLDGMGLSRLLGNSYGIGLKVGLREWSGNQYLGSIAGTLPLGARGLLIRDRKPSDGTVAVNETRIKGMSSHITKKLSHTALIYSTTTSKLIDEFVNKNTFY